MLERFQQLPRAVRWLVVAAVFIALFRVWDLTIGDLSRAWAKEAETVERQITAVRDSAVLTDELEDLENAILGLGPVRAPGRQDEGRTALTLAVVDVLENEPHNIDHYEFDLSGGGDRLPQDLSRDLVRPGNRVSRLTCTVGFDAKPERAIAVIGDLENRDEIEAIRKISITKGDRGTVKVSLTLESWVEVPANRRRG
jgi:hypothetical protein